MSQMIGVGRRQPVESPGGLLMECHGRIRSCTALALRVAEAHDAPPAQLDEACARLVRYFTVALPLHIADEELSVEPRLAEAAPEVRAALEEMEREHREIEPLLERLCEAWRTRRGAGTSADAQALSSHMERHLAREERVVLPALAALPRDQQAAVMQEMRARRQPV